MRLSTSLVALLLTYIMKWRRGTSYSAAGLPGAMFVTNNSLQSDRAIIAVPKSGVSILAPRHQTEDLQCHFEQGNIGMLRFLWMEPRRTVICSDSFGAARAKSHRYFIGFPSTYRTISPANSPVSRVVAT